MQRNGKVPSGPLIGRAIRGILLFILVVVVCYRPSISSIAATTQNQARAITCPTYSFPSRTPEEVSNINEKWDKGRQFVMEKKLSFLQLNALKMHRDLIHEIESQKVNGMMLECGIAKGGSSVLLSIVKNPDRCFHMFDTFQGMPPPTSSDGPDVHKRYKDIQDGKGGQNYYGYMKDLQGFVQNNIDQGGNPSQVHLHQGLFQDTVWPAGPVAFAHLDGDWYESTIRVLERVHPVLSEGGYIVLDDVEHYSGARDALGDFFNMDVAQWLKSAKSKNTKNTDNTIDSANCLVQRDGIKYSMEFRVRVIAKKIYTKKGNTDAGTDETLLKLCASKPIEKK